MKKLIAFLLAAMLMFPFSLGAADVNWGTKDLNEGEIAAYVLSVLWGNGAVMDLEPMIDYDKINSRYIFIGDEELGSELVVMIRTSESQVCLWMLDLNKENLIKAKTAMDENAPMCYVALYENGTEAKSAIYIKSLNMIFPYEKFSSDMEDVFKAISGEMSQDVSYDPVLSLFPGLVWGMSQDEMIEKYGSYSFSDVGKVENIIGAYKSVLGVETHIAFMFYEGKLDSIVLLGVKDRIEQFMEEYSKIYGEPVKVSFMDTIMGDYTEKADGDSYVWKAGQTYIMINGMIPDIEYKPLY